MPFYAELENPFFLFVFVIAAGVGSQWLAARLRFPVILLLLTAGLLAGPGTGIVDPDATVAQQRGGANALDLRLIVCSGDVCLREDLRLRLTREGFEVSAVDATDDPPAELDPGPGARTGWLAERIAEHAFVVLLFYRGFW